MLESLCSNVLVTKMKAINSKRLTPQDYNELLKKKYVSDIVTYLKETHFNAVLQGVDAGSIKCDELEGLLKIARIMEYKKMLIGFLTVFLNYSGWTLNLNSSLRCCCFLKLAEVKILV